MLRRRGTFDAIVGFGSQSLSLSALFTILIVWSTCLEAIKGIMLFINDLYVAENLIADATRIKNTSRLEFT